MVVRTQRSRILSDHAVSRLDVLLSTEGSRASGIQLQAFDDSLLVTGLYLHLGWSASSSLLGAARVGVLVGDTRWGCSLGMLVGITFYGVSTFEGPMLSIRSINGLSHYTDWTIAHVHSGALGWNGMMIFGMTFMS